MEHYAIKLENSYGAFCAWASWDLVSLTFNLMDWKCYCKFQLPWGITALNMNFPRPSIIQLKCARDRRTDRRSAMRNAEQKSSQEHCYRQYYWAHRCCRRRQLKQSLDSKKQRNKDANCTLSVCGANVPEIRRVCSVCRCRLTPLCIRASLVLHSLTEIKWISQLTP